MVRRLIVLLCFAAAAPAAAAQPAPEALEPTLKSVLVRAAVYVNAFHRQLASIVAEERYIQDAVTPPSKALVEGSVEHRELLSDLLLVKPSPNREWLQFRDVFEVDGNPVRDRTERLTRLFLRPSASTSAQIEQILNESARFNIGHIQRNINAPLMPLLFLEADNQWRFKFKRTRDRQPVVAPTEGPSGAVFRVNAEVWVIEYQEQGRPTFIRSTSFQPMPARGRFWVEPLTGRVLMSEMILRNRDVRATIDVSYQSEPLLGFLVPIEMRERYDGRGKEHIDGTATYGRLRQFQVSTNETFLLKR
jgi:hypothetical protein